MRHPKAFLNVGSFPNEIHHQNTAEMQMVEITNGKPAVVESFTISEPVPLDVLLKK